MNEDSFLLDRRQLLHVTTAAGAASVLGAESALPVEPEAPSVRIVDTNLSLFQWPCRRLPLDDTKDLVRKLRSLGIAQAWAGSFEGILHRDMAGVNQRLAEECQRYTELLPIGSVNLKLPDWEDDLRRCIEQHKMPGIRLHPNYHGYALGDPRFVKLLKSATKAGRLVQIVSAMEDTRTQHPLLQVPDVDLAPLPGLMQQVSRARVQLLNHRPRSPLLDRLAAAPGIYFDTARVDGTDGVPQLVARAGRDRVMVGTHAPFLLPEAALIRVHESGLLDESALRSVFSGNAAQALEKAGI